MLCTLGMQEPAQPIKIILGLLPWSLSEVDLDGVQALRVPMSFLLIVLFLFK